MARHPITFITDEGKRIFWDKVGIAEPEECWEWLKCRSRAGYGVASFQNGHSSTAVAMATHAALFLSGFPRPKGAMALHSCDNPPCCNPAHLRWGNARENANDMMARNRGNPGKGEMLPQAKLTSAIVMEIRSQPPSVSNLELAEYYKVHNCLISRVRTGKRWAHVA